MNRALLAIALLAGAAAAQRPNTSMAGDDVVVVGRRNDDVVVTGRKPSDPCGIVRQVFVSPIGQPFRALPGEPEPIGQWFDHVDRDKDGAIDAAEMAEDADTWFDRVDRDGDGEIGPDEMIVYERDTVPEVSTYERTAADRAAAAKARGKEVPYGAPVGAARFGLTNVPHPLASADTDYNRGITRAELEAVSARAFAALAKGRDRIVRADLPATLQQDHIRRCKGEAIRGAGAVRGGDRKGKRPR